MGLLFIFIKCGFFSYLVSDPRSTIPHRNPTKKGGHIALPLQHDGWTALIPPLGCAQDGIRADLVMLIKRNAVPALAEIIYTQRGNRMPAHRAQPR